MRCCGTMGHRRAEVTGHALMDDGASSPRFGRIFRAAATDHGAAGANQLNKGLPAGSVGCELQRGQLRVQATGGNQRGMRARFRDAALIHHHDAGCALHRG